MSHGTGHNALNRTRQRDREEGEFQRHDPVGKAKQAKSLDAAKLAEEEATERAKGRMDFCSSCGEFFRSNSPDIGLFVCSECKRKAISQ
jgi:hypothetical protein